MMVVVKAGYRRWWWSIDRGEGWIKIQPYYFIVTIYYKNKP